jgi:hypothetical protein
MIAAGCEIASSIDRIDEPGRATGCQPAENRRIFRDGFLADDLRARDEFREPLGQPVFGFDIGDRNDFAGFLFHDLVPSQPLEPGHDVALGRFADDRDHRI